MVFAGTQVDGDPAMGKVFNFAVFKSIFHKWNEQQRRDVQVGATFIKMHFYIESAAVFQHLKVDEILQVGNFLMQGNLFRLAIVQHIT